jgi:hypothetical protein
VQSTDTLLRIYETRGFSHTLVGIKSRARSIAWMGDGRIIFSIGAMMNTHQVDRRGGPLPGVKFAESEADITRFVRDF